MKRIVICDSGLGGLDVAARCCSKEGGDCEIVYFNAWPAPGIGYNKLASAGAQQAVFQSALEGMAAFSPERVVIACNTLSIIWEGLRQKYTPPFPVTGIVDVAVAGMLDFLQEEPGRMLWILGTRTTIESKVYFSRLVNAGISASRLREIPCPGLATLLERNPRSSEVAEAISHCAEIARTQVPQAPGLYGIAFCCTHFGYAEDIWQREFTRTMGSAPVVLNPNGWFPDLEKASCISYHSRIPFEGDAQECMARFFDSRSPMIAAALRTANIEEDLFHPQLGE